MSWECVGSIFGRFGVSWGVLGKVLGTLGRLLGHLGGVFGDVGRPWGHHGSHEAVLDALRPNCPGARAAQNRSGPTPVVVSELFEMRKRSENGNERRSSLSSYEAAGGGKGRPVEKLPPRVE